MSEQEMLAYIKERFPYATVRRDPYGERKVGYMVSCQAHEIEAIHAILMAWPTAPHPDTAQTTPAQSAPTDLPPVQPE